MYFYNCVYYSKFLTKCFKIGNFLLDIFLSKRKNKNKSLKLTKRYHIISSNLNIKSRNAQPKKF